MAHLSIELPETFKDEFKTLLSIAAREAIATAKQKEVSYGREWLKQKEMCDYLNISYGTLQLWRSKGLRVATVEGITLISKKEINRFLEEKQI